MRVVIDQKQLDVSTRLIKDVNLFVASFNGKNYSKIENIENILINRNISVEKKKSILMKNLHLSVAKAFSINKKKFKLKSLESLRSRIKNIRRLIIKLRSANYYLETIFLNELRFAKIRLGKDKNDFKHQETIGNDELEALEFTTYRLIEEVVMLDKRILNEYAAREKVVIKKEKAEVKDLGSILRVETTLLEHLEAKLPAPMVTNSELINDPIFTHWVARILALLSTIERLYEKESSIINKLKCNKMAKSIINKKIIHIMREKSKLLRIMEEKTMSIRKLKFNKKLKDELHNLTTTIRL